MNSLFDLQLVDMIPAGTLQDMVRANARDVIQFATLAARKHYKLADSEVMGVMFFEHQDAQGRPTIGLLPTVLEKGTLITVRKLPWIDLGAFLEVAPIEQWITKGKKYKKALDKVESLQKALQAAVAKQDTKGIGRIGAKLQVAMEGLPPFILNALQEAAPKAAQLPAPKEPAQ